MSCLLKGSQPYYITLRKSLLIFGFFLTYYSLQQFFFPPYYAAQSLIMTSAHISLNTSCTATEILAIPNVLIVLLEYTNYLHLVVAYLGGLPALDLVTTILSLLQFSLSPAIIAECIPIMLTVCSFLLPLYYSNNYSWKSGVSLTSMLI